MGRFKSNFDINYIGVCPECDEGVVRVYDTFAGFKELACDHCGASHEVIITDDSDEGEEDELASDE